LWKMQGGDVEIVAIKKWRGIALAIDAEADTMPASLVATVDAMYADNSLSAEQKGEWDSEKSDVTTAVADVQMVLRGELPQ